MLCLKTFTDFATTRKAYIYMIVCSEPPAIYIGQTINSLGAIGRFAQHVSHGPSNTFRQRILQHYKLDLTNLDNISFFAEALPIKKTYLQGAEDYRESVESLVQEKLITEIIERRHPIPVISRALACPLRELAYIQDDAQRIAQAFKDHLFPAQLP